ncbi:MAG: ribonuclease R [Bacteroidota bacterium]|nr:ribonuclease R [Bacteroidota bacterium]
MRERGKKKSRSKIYIVGKIEINYSKQIFVIPEDNSESIKISRGNSLNAMEGDEVKVYVLPRRGRGRQGQIVEILKRRKERFAGILEKHKNFAYFIPDDENINTKFYIEKPNLPYTNNDKAIVTLINSENNHKEPSAKIIKVLGKKGDNEVEMESILANNDFAIEFPKDVLKQANKITFDIKEEEKTRKDFRKITTFTIDPKDAKDFDDALSFRILPNGNYEVGVHIADVTFFVKPNSPLDKEAYKRATSVYLVDRTIPMLPERLSNELCSLRQGEDSLCYSVVFEIDKEKKIVNHWIGRTIIHSDRRFKYEDVQKVIEDKKGEMAEYLLPLWDIAQSFRTERIKKGAINFDSPEYVFDLDENKKPIGIHLKISKEANWLVEEWMLLANRTVAEEVGKVKNKKDVKTFVYRIHDEPNNEKVDAFKTFASKFGYLIDNKNRNTLTRSYNSVLNEVKGSKFETMFSIIALRTMSKAIYSCDNIGHYGLSFKYYTHFTSPIRRYPDMMVHRLLTLYGQKGSSVDKTEFEDYCKHCSEMEKRAAEAERESVKFKQAEFLLNKVGEKFDAEVSGISRWGVYVTTMQDKCEGMVRISDMKDDFYMVDEDNYQVIGRDNEKAYRLGDRVRVQLIKVDLDKRQIDFVFIDE